MKASKHARQKAPARAKEQPRITPLWLDDLRDATEREVLDAARVDAARLTDCDLSGVDLEGLHAAETLWRGVRLHETRLDRATFLETRFERLDAPVLQAARSTWREVELVDSRIGSGELYDAELRTVHVSGCRLGYLNLRDAVLTDVLVEDSAIDELDLAGARATRVALRGCRVGALVLNRAVLTHVDLRGVEGLSRVEGIDGLRGATITPEQLALLAPLLAEHVGLQVRE